MSRDTLFARTSLDDLAITYAYRVAHHALTHDDAYNVDNARDMTRCVRDVIARDIVHDARCDNDACATHTTRIMTRVNNAIIVANDTRNARHTIDVDDAHDVRMFVAYMTRHDDASRQCARYVRRVARYARTIIVDDLLMSRNERNALRRNA